MITVLKAFVEGGMGDEKSRGKMFGAIICNEI